MRHCFVVSGLVLAWSCCARGGEVAPRAAPPLPGQIEFNRDVRPILADKCFHCHGPDAAHRQAELRLDQRDAAISAGAIVPGQLAQSLLIERISASDDESRMPPPTSNKQLTSREQEILRRWIAAGAEYQGHWAYLPLHAPAVPLLPKPSTSATGPTGSARQTENRSIHPIDHFVLARLAAENLSPSPPADRATLIRRVSLDLTGIPPTPEEVDAFVADDSADAYDRLVDRLLASPRYGERMAMQWLDYARYADSNGFQTDSSRQMWPWREWVIEAFNRNLPFDQFTIEQLAGDLLPHPSTEQIVATGFHRNTRLNGEGGRIVEEWFAETVIDRVETTGQTWLALTIGCCRCHDHKYDPLTQKEFYQLFAFFNSIDESGVLDSEGGKRGGGNSRPLLAAPTAQQRTQLTHGEAAVKEAEDRLAAAREQLPMLQRAWEERAAASEAAQPQLWTPLTPARVTSQGGADFQRLEDGSWLAGGKSPDRDVYTITISLPAGELTGLRLEVLPDPSLPNQSLGRATNGNFVLTGIAAEIAAPSLEKPQPVSFSKAEASYQQQGYPIASLVSRGPAQGWAIDGNDPEKRLVRQAMFVADAPVPVPAEAELIVRLTHASRFAKHNIGRFRLSVTSVAPALVKLADVGLPAAVRAALSTAAEQRTPAQRADLAKYFREEIDNPLLRAAAEVAAARQKLADLQSSLPTTMVMKELEKPRDAFLLKRGEYHNRGEKVSRAVPAIFPPLPENAPLDRLGLAQWLVSPSHPLTARVWVNRQWEKFFGTGLVKTVDNFGLQSEPPSHPDLLDWLAAEFIRRKWDMKALQKLIVTSATYRQSSHVAPAQWERDPENRLLARGPRFRLPAELLRDQALAASGLLVEKIGGPSVRPYMPQGVWDETSKYGDLRGYKHDQGDGLYRRTLYTIWKRTAAPPTMLMFDSPSREVCAVKRSRTNTPLQALALLNEVTFVEAARVLAQRMMREGGTSSAERIRWGFRRVVCRQPEAAEVSILEQGYQRHLARFRTEPDSAQKLLALGEMPRDSAYDPAELAAYTLVANVLLNLDEVVTKE